MSSSLSMRQKHGGTKMPKKHKTVLKKEEKIREIEPTPGEQYCDLKAAP